MAAIGLSGPLLTAREAEVMAWVACGKTHSDVAGMLGMSPRTVNQRLVHSRHAGQDRSEGVSKYQSFDLGGHFVPLFVQGGELLS